MAKVFLSSVVRGLEAARDAADSAARTLDHVVTRAEDFPASPSSPREACLAAARDADVVVLIAGERYGDRQPSGLSATHEEFREAVENNVRVLGFVQSGVDRGPDQEAFVHEMQGWASGVYTATFSTPEELARKVTRALHQWELSQAAGPIDEQEMHERAQSLLPAGRGDIGAVEQLGLIVVGGPHRQVLRPAELEDSQLGRDLQREATFGTWPVLDATEGTSTQLIGHTLKLEQSRSSLSLAEDGSVRVILAAKSEQRRTYLPVLIEEDVAERLERAIRFASWTLDRVDDVRRLSDVVIVAFLAGAGYSGWKTRAEHDRDPNTAHMGLGGRSLIVVTPAPKRRARAALVHDAASLAEDLTVLLRREVTR